MDPFSGTRALAKHARGRDVESPFSRPGVAAIVLLPYAYLMKDTPKAALAAVVIAAVGPGVCRPKAVLKLGAADALVAWSTALASVVADPTTGFCLGLAFAALVSTVAPKKKSA